MVICGTAIDENSRERAQRLGVAATLTEKDTCHLLDLIRQLRSPSRDKQVERD